MDQIKKAFQKVRTDMNELRNDLDLIRVEIRDLKEFILNKPVKTSTDNTLNKTQLQNSSTHSSALEGLKRVNLPISTGNEGVSTDRQTDRQTNRQIDSKEISTIDNAAEILESLDNLKKQIRLKFKRLTNQEFLVFSMLYQLDIENSYATYKHLSSKLNLTESSIRDYVGRLINKGVPIEKIKVNNKNIHLNISENLKKIATLPTIIQLRDL